MTTDSEQTTDEVGMAAIALVHDALGKAGVQFIPEIKMGAAYVCLSDGGDVMTEDIIDKVAIAMRQIQASLNTLIERVAKEARDAK